MRKNETKTDLWVYDLLKESKIHLEPKSCSIKEINEALKTASKRCTGKIGYPEYIGVIKDFLIVIEDKSDLSDHIILKQKYKIFMKNNLTTIEYPNNNIKWKDFCLTDLFIPDKGNQNNMNSLKEGDIPLVSAKKFNNGYKAFVAPNNKKSYQGHILTLNIDGDGGAGIAYYQPCEHLLDSHVTALIPKEKNLSKYTLLFIATAITKQRDKYGHGYSIKNDRLNIFRFMLPIDEQEYPDYSYMHKYMKYIEQKKIQEYLDYTK